MVLDTKSHLTTIEEKRAALESHIADGAGNDNVQLATQELVAALKDYRQAATHVKKVSTKPKPKAKAKPENAEPNQNGSA